MLPDLFHGFWLPVTLGQAVLKDERVRRRWWRYSSRQALATVLLAAAMVAVGGGWRYRGASERSRAAVAAIDEIRRAVDARAEELAQDAPDAQAEVIEREAELIGEQLEKSGGLVRKLTAEEGSRRTALDEQDLERAASKRELSKRDHKRRRRRAAATVGTDAGEAGALAEAPTTTTPEPSANDPVVDEIRADLRRAAFEAERAGDEQIQRDTAAISKLEAMGLPANAWALAVAIWGVLYIAQFIVIALCTDHYSELFREACLLAGVEPEDPERVPRIHFSFKWARKRARRYLRGCLVVGVGIPLWSALAIPFPSGAEGVIRAVLVTAWVAYWQAVFAAARSQRAWVNEDVAPDPWFIRGYLWLVDHVPLLWWALPKAYGRLWRRLSRGLFAPAECVEQQPAAFAGLAAFRLLGSLPVVRIFVRPLIPVASAVLLESYRQRSPAPSALAPGA